MKVQAINTNIQNNRKSFGAKPVKYAKTVLTDALAQVYKENPLVKWLHPQTAENLAIAEKALGDIADFGKGLKVKIDAYRDIYPERINFYIESVNGAAPKSQIADNVFSRIPTETKPLEMLQKVAQDLKQSALSVELLKKTPEQKAAKYINNLFG